MVQTDLAGSHRVVPIGSFARGGDFGSGANGKSRAYSPGSSAPSTKPGGIALLGPVRA